MSDRKSAGIYPSCRLIEDYARKSDLTEIRVKNTGIDDAERFLEEDTAGFEIAGFEETVGFEIADL